MTTLEKTKTKPKPKKIKHKKSKIKTLSFARLKKIREETK